MINRNKILLALLTLFVLIVAAYFLWKPKPAEMHLNPVRYSTLPGWDSGDLMPSFAPFKASCQVFLKADPEKSVGSYFISLKAKDWLPACKAALLLPASPTSKQLREFFQTWLEPVEFHNGKAVEGLFTGYYMSSLKGSLTKTKHFNVPIYGMPEDLVMVRLSEFDPAFKNRKLAGRLANPHHLVPYYTRAEIDNGVLKGKAPILAWVDSKIDRLFLEIQGSGVVELPDGAMLHLGYAAQNGAPYTAIAAVLIKRGVMTKDNASMQGIRKYLEAHPQEIQPVLNENQSFVFFEKSAQPEAFGTQGVPLTPGYSMAVDIDWVPMGVPVWLNTKRPDAKKRDKTHDLNRLMIAQDTGGAIRGSVRGDIYWGAGKRAASIAGRMKHPGHYWMLLPKQAWEQHDVKG